MTLRKMLTLGSLMALAACGGQATTDKGQLSLALTSSSATPLAALATAASSDNDCGSIQAANATFSAIEARTLDGLLIAATPEGGFPVTVDLMSLVKVNPTTLPSAWLPAGTYDQIVVVIRKVEVTLTSGWKVAVSPPGGGWTAVIDIAPPFTISAASPKTVTLGFRKDLSFLCNLGEWKFNPKFEHDGKHDDGHH